MNPNSKRKYQLGIGFAIFAFAVSVSYFSVVEADVQDTPKYDIYLVIDVSGSMQEESKLVFAKQAALEFVDAFQLDQSSDHRIGLCGYWPGDGQKRWGHGVAIGQYDEGRRIDCVSKIFITVGKLNKFLACIDQSGIIVCRTAKRGEPRVD